MTIANWAHGQPFHLAAEGLGCAAAHGSRSELNLPGQWYIAPCGQKKFALCEAPREGYTAPTLPSTPFPTGCPAGWSTPDGTSRNCFKVSIEL